jgi:Domain of unknown function (DUF4214)
MRLSLRSLLNRHKRKKSSRRPAPVAPRSRLSVEGLENRTLLSITFSGPGNSGVATLTGTPGPDQFVIQLKPMDATTIEFSDDGGATFTDATLSGITSVVVNGLQGRDMLTLNEDNELTALAAGLPIAFNGGRGRDTLIVQGSPTGTITETFAPGTGAGSGMLTISDGTVSSTITLDNVERIRDTMTADTLTINADDNNNVIRLHNGPIVNGVQTNTVRIADVEHLDLGADDSQSGDQGDQDNNDDHETGDVNDQGNSGSQQGDDNGQGDDHHNGDDNGQGDEGEAAKSFPSISFANKTNVIINGLGGDDLFVVDVTQSAAGLKTLTLDGGTGTNVLAARNLPPGVTVTQKNIQQQVTDTDDIFVEEMYQERLERPASAAEVAIWKNVMDGPAGQAGVVQGIEQSPEARTMVVKQFYQRYLGRQAVNGEEQGWVNALMRGQREEVVLAGILASPGVLRPRPDADHQRHGRRALRSGHVSVAFEPHGLGGRGERLVERAADHWPFRRGHGFVESNEFRADTVAAFYAMFLHRNPDLPGLNAWVNSSLDLAHVRLRFEGSAEFMHNG